MSLALIVGPPNSGRSGEVLARIRAALEREPILIVPTGDDAANFERDLAAGSGAAIGVSVRTFSSLVDEISAITGEPIGPELSRPQRLALIRAAIGSTELRVFRRSSRSTGFAIALDALIAELQAALVEPAELRAAAEAAGGAAQEIELAALLATYEELRERAGARDAGTRAVAAADALRRSPAAISDRPVFVYGFDDLSEAQLELVRLLAAATEVTLAVNYADRKALSARAALYARLREEPGCTVAAELDFDPAYTERASLRMLDRELFEAVEETAPPDDGLRLLECAGARGEAEAVGIEIAKLIAAGADPGAIVIALRQPAVHGPAFAAALRAIGVPAALETDVPLDRTAVGRSLVALCRLGTEGGTPADLLAHLRSDSSLPPELADWAERRAARGAGSADELVEGWEHPPGHLARLGEAEGPAGRLRSLADSARRLAENAHRERAPLVGDRSAGTPLDAVELRAGAVAAELLDELALVAELPGCEPADLADAAEAIESAGVRAWRGSAEGRVRIVSPYRVRAARARYLFCCTLQEGVFPGSGRDDPLLGDERRSALGLPGLARQSQPDEERYLFHACVSRPTDRLYLSWRSSDDEGSPAPRSPFVDEVLDLIGADPQQTERELGAIRGLAAVVPAAADAPTARLLARSLALECGGDATAIEARLERLDVPAAVAEEVLSLTAAIPDPSALPGPLKHPQVLEAIGSRKDLSANSLERWIGCSYQWFVDHELSPQRLEPTPDPLWLGSVVHDALERLYAEAPGSDSVPRPGDIGRWKSRFAELLAAIVADDGGINAARRLALARLELQVDAFLESEADSATPLRPTMFERSFGFPEIEGDPGALQLGDFALRGRIDRIDQVPGSTTAVLRDYKTSRAVPGLVGVRKDGKLQLQLYMLVMRDLLGLDPVGGLYFPLGARGRSARRGRGLLRKDESELLKTLEVSIRADALEPDDFEAELEGARAFAIEKGGDMLAGKIARDPRNQVCSRYCEFQPICRLERAVGLEDENGDERS